MYKFISKIVRLLPIKAQTFFSIIFFIIESKIGKFNSTESEWGRMHEMISPGNLVIDIGANVGRYTLKMSHLVGKDGLVLAFEPNPRVFNILSNIIYYSSVNNVSLLNIGISDTNGFFKLNESWNTPTVDHIFNTNTDTKLSSEYGNILAIKLDDLNIQRKIGLIKIDIEGMEMAACNGMIKTLTIHKPIVIVENNDKNLIDFFENIGYRLIREKNKSRNMTFKYD